MSPRVLRLVLAVFVGAAASVVAVGSIQRPTRSAAPAPGDGGDPAVVAAFVDHWEAWRRATALFTESTDRTSGDERLTESVSIAQRFPDRVVRTGGDVSARLDGRLIGCSEASATAGAICVDNGGFDPERELGLELDETRDLTTGSTPRYRVSDLGGGCYRLRHLVTEFRPYWGDRADVCFDERTGVAVSETTITGELTVTVTRTAIIGSVTDDDLALPAPITQR